MTLRDKFLAVRDDLNSVLLERSSAVDNSILALLSGQHFLQLGPPGTAKSLLVREVCKRLEGAQYFEKLMTAFSVPEEIFGPIDLVQYAEHGTYRRIADGSLSQAHIGFLDEVFKANSAILNSLLSIANERLLHEVGQAPQHVPLLSLFAASNETPQDSSLQALDDRFLLREIVEPVSEEASFYALVSGAARKRSVQATITLDDLIQAQAEVDAVKGTMEALQALWSLRGQLSAQGVAVSDRRFAQCGPLLKAKAWLDGQTAIDTEHLTCLVHALWTDPKEKAVVQRLVFEIACPLSLRAIEMEDSASELMGKLPAQDSADYNSCAENVVMQLRDMYNLLKSDVESSSARNTDRAQQSMSKIHGYHKQVSSVLFKAVTKLSLAV